VLPDSPPSIDTAATGIVRADSDGTVDVFNGTYLLPTIKASVKSLKPASTEKNTLTYRVSTRAHSAGSYVVKSGPTTPGGITMNTTISQFGTYDVSDSWDVLIEVIDVFATTAYLIVVPTGAAILDLRPAGVGVLKRWEQGALDVGGDVYVAGSVYGTTNTKLRLPSTGDVSPTSTGHPLQLGPDNGANIAIDNNEIMARNNGAVAALGLNNEGGDIGLGNTSSTVKITGALKLWGVTFEAAEGTASGVSVVAGGATSTTVTFPTGRFSAAPRVTATLLGDARNITSNVDAASTTSVVIRLADAGSTARSGLGFNWIGMRIR
jgi:hypothetical protein